MPQLPPRALTNPIAPSRQRSSIICYCIGINNEILTDFTSSSYANRGFASTIYSYDVGSKAWRSPNCTIILDEDDDQQCNQCNSCLSSSRSVSLSLPEANHQSNWNYDALVTSKLELHRIIRRQYELADSSNLRFVQCRVVQRAMLILRVIHKDLELVSLDDDGTTYAQHCSLQGESCQGVDVVLQKRKALNYNDGVCVLCRPLKRPRLKSPPDDMENLDLHSKHNLSLMTRDQLLFLAQKKNKHLKAVSRQLRETRKLLAKNKDTAFIHPEDKELRDIMLSAATYVTSDLTNCKKCIILALLQQSSPTDQPPIEKSEEISEFAN